MLDATVTKLFRNLECSDFNVEKDLPVLLRGIGLLVNEKNGRIENAIEELKPCATFSGRQLTCESRKIRSTIVRIENGILSGRIIHRRSSSAGKSKPNYSLMSVDKGLEELINHNLVDYYSTGDYVVGRVGWLYALFRTYRNMEVGPISSQTYTNCLSDFSSNIGVCEEILRVRNDTRGRREASARFDENKDTHD